MMSKNVKLRLKMHNQIHDQTQIPISFLFFPVSPGPACHPALPSHGTYVRSLLLFLFLYKNYHAAIAPTER